MGMFSSKSSRRGRTWANTNVKNSRIDPATGRNKRDKCTVNERKGIRPERQIGTGKVVSRAEFRRQQKLARRRGR